jgi:hypothetical protein
MQAARSTTNTAEPTSDHLLQLPCPAIQVSLCKLISFVVGLPVVDYFGVRDGTPYASALSKICLSLTAHDQQCGAAVMFLSSQLK